MKAKNIGKIVAAFILPAAAVVTYYVVDRAFIKKAPLWPLDLKKAREKKANNALSEAKKKLNKMMDEGRIHGFGVMYDEAKKKYYIEVASDNITQSLRNDVPVSVKGVDVVLMEKPIAKAQ